MRLAITLKDEHHEIASAVTWSPDGQLWSCSDDKEIIRWSAEGEKSGSFKVEVFVTSIAWFPGSGKQISDLFAISCTDGTYRFFSRSGREEKKVSAHEGAVISIKWSRDGSAILTSGEDGDVKIWSKTGNLRSTLLSFEQSVYSVCWGPDDDQVLAANGKALVIKSIQANKKNLQWNAHDGIVLCADWNISNGFIVSGGEDCTYKVWDAFGRQLYSSRAMEHVVTSIAWSPNGESFAVGSFNLIRLCDKVGWTHCRERLKSGSIVNISWTSDGTQFACAGGNGSVIFSQLVDRRFEWKNSEVVVLGPRKFRVQDVLNESSEDIELSRDRIVEVALGFDHLIVTTTNQCYIYSVANTNTPIIYDIKAPPLFLHICRRHFLTVDQLNGIQIVSFEGRVISSPKFQNLRAEFLTRDYVSLSPDTVAIVDPVDQKNIQIHESTTGKVIGKIVHTNNEVCGVFLNQLNFGTQERVLVFVDRNRDLFISNLYAGPSNVSNGILNVPIIKLFSHVDSFAFNDDTNTLVGLADGRMNFWYHPEVVFVDRDLLPLVSTSFDGEEFGRNAQIMSFTGNRVSLRKIDGSIVYTSSSPDIPLLDDLARQNKWEEATRLCRFQKSNFLWASFAAIALNKKHLDSAEIALAELNEVAKLEFIQYIKEIPSEEGKQAALALYRRAPDDAERILLQSSPPLVYRAIKMNIDLFRWNRALDISLKYKTHTDTVLAYRQKYLDAFQKDESDPKFLQYFNQINFNWDDIREKEKDELSEEAKRGGKNSRK